MTMEQNQEVINIQEQYMPKQSTKLDELKALDRKVKLPAQIFGYTFGSVGALVLGTGMCLSMKVMGNMMPLGIVIGLAGIAMVSANYFLYDKILKKRKQKRAKEVLALSKELLGE